MRQSAQIAALCAGLSLYTHVVLAQTGPDDPLASGQVIELSFGLLTPVNTLQDTLTTLNGGGPQLQSTDALDFGPGSRVAVAYSRPWGSTARLIFSLTGAQATGDATITVGPRAETFPGSYDDGFNLPANWTVETEVETKMALLTLGKEWALSGGWRISAGVQGGTASQDLTGLLRVTDGELWRTLTTRSNNRMIGIFGGVSHYAALSEVIGLRLSGTLGVMHNRFDYDYVNVLNPTDLPPSGQTISGSDSGTAVSTRLSARLERKLSDRGLLSVEVGYEGLTGIGNGVDTFLDAGGTRRAAKIDSDSIGASYVNVGYAFRF